LDPSDQPQLKITENLEVTVYTSMSSGLYWASAVLAVVIGIFALDIMGLFSWKNHLDVDGQVWHYIVDEMRWEYTEADIQLQTVLLTGGSSGMGRGVAKILAQKGANIVIVARNQERLAEALSYASVSHFSSNLHSATQSQSYWTICRLLPKTLPSSDSQPSLQM
jgi:NADPH:quinone reductase-like Zn-dependent oxidoreductase